MFLLFRRPIVIGCIKVDINLIYSGEMKQCDLTSADNVQSILFTNNPIVVRREKNNIYRTPLEPMVFIDNQHIMLPVYS